MTEPGALFSGIRTEFLDLVNVGEQHDAQLLRIIEAYCSGAVRAVPAAADCRPPQLIVAEDEKILVEEVVGDEIVIQEKYVAVLLYLPFLRSFFCRTICMCSTFTIVLVGKLSSLAYSGVQVNIYGYHCTI